MTAAEEIDFAIRTRPGRPSAGTVSARTDPVLFRPNRSGEGVSEHAGSVATIRSRWEDGMERIHGRNGVAEGAEAA